MHGPKRFLLLLTAAALLAAGCGGTVDADAGSPAPADGGGADGDAGDGGEELPGDGVDGDEGAADGAAGACLEGTEDCVDTPGLEDPGLGDEQVPADIEVVTSTPEQHRLVEPRDVVDDRFPVFLQWAIEDGTTLTVGYYAGVEPCFVTAEVIVSELEDVVAVTVLGGPDRDAGDVACIDIAEALAVEVELDAPLDGRRLVDGARATPEDLGA